MARGIVRKIDELGRITLPMEYRRAMDLEPGTFMDLYIEGKVIHLKKGKGRKLDELGRYTLPIEVRRSLGIAEKDPVDMYMAGEEICVRKNSKECAICGRTGELFELYPVKEVHICKNCALAVTDMVMDKGL